MALTAAEIVDLRRFLGYPPTPTLITDPPAALLAGGISPELETVVRAKLTTINAANAAIEAAYNGLDTKKAAVYERDLDEIQRRLEHLRILRTDLAAMLGIETGPWLGAGLFVPAVYIV